MIVKKLLLVDDDDDVRKVATLILTRIGKFDVHAAATGEEALSAALTEAPDMIILDAMMPGMDGLTVLGKLSENPATAAIPVVFMTAGSRSGREDEFISAGALGVIAKPFDPVALPGQIRAIAEKI